MDDTEKIKAFLMDYYKHLAEKKNRWGFLRNQKDEREFYNGMYEACKQLQIHLGLRLKNDLDINIFELIEDE